MSLTESKAMLPASSVSGFYFSHPESKYFSVDKIDEDQLKDLATRRGVHIDQLRRWLASNIK
jgi:5-methyltetrahydrofolate--homocysteine methyltransferase